MIEKQQSDEPSPTKATGRSSTGKFAKGNSFGKGNPLAKRQAEYRLAFEKAISTKDLEAIARAMAIAAKGGDTVAARLICDYMLGKPITPIAVETTDAVPVRIHLHLQAEQERGQEANV